MQKQADDNFFERKSNKVKKLTFLNNPDGFIAKFGAMKLIGITVIVSSLAYYGNNVSTNYFAEQEVQAKQEIAIEKLNKENRINDLTNQIKMISQDDFNNYINYLKTNQNIYDEKVSLISNSLIEAEKSWFNGKDNNPKQVRSIEDIKGLKKIALEYKQTFIEGIDEHSGVFNDINKYNKKDFSIHDAESLLKYYHLYQANTMLVSKELETEITNILYTTYPGNKKYNSDNQIYELAEKIDLKNKELFKSINSSSSSNKP